jgi:hypothetical protein
MSVVWTCDDEGAGGGGSGDNELDCDDEIIGDGDGDGASTSEDNIDGVMHPPLLVASALHDMAEKKD